jgi:hypothetical protein
MEKPCFKKEGSNPPVCGVHDVPLGESHSSEELSATGLGEFTFWRCPVTGQVIDHDSTHF